MNHPIKIYCVNHKGKPISADMFRYIADAALKLIYQEKKSITICKKDFNLILKTEFQEVSFAGITGYGIFVRLETQSGVRNSVMLANTTVLEHMIDEGNELEIINLIEDFDNKMKSKPNIESKTVEPKQKTKIPKPSLN